jgi:hypothetical protein
MNVIHAVCIDCGAKWKVCRTQNRKRVSKWCTRCQGARRNAKARERSATFFAAQKLCNTAARLSENVDREPGLDRAVGDDR